MEIEEFNQLNEIEKEEVVLDDGIFISASYDEDIAYDTYQVNNFFVQISYKLNEIKGLSIHASSNLKQLMPYIVDGYAGDHMSSRKSLNTGE